MSPSRVVRAVSIAIAFSTLIFVSVAASAWHLDLTASYPQADQVLAESPDTVRLWFNQAPELSLAGISIEGRVVRSRWGRPRRPTIRNRSRRRCWNSYSPDLIGLSGARRAATVMPSVADMTLKCAPVPARRISVPGREQVGIQ